MQVEVVTKKSMYGYYSDGMPFFKLYLWRPQDVPIVTSVLQVSRC